MSSDHASPATVGERLREVLLSFNSAGARRTLDLIPDLYADDVYFQDPLQTAHGKDAFMEMNRRFFAKGQELVVAIDSLVEEGENIFVSWTMTFRPRFGPAITVEGATHARARDGLIFYHRDYWDLLGSIFSSLPIARTLWARAARHLG